MGVLTNPAVVVFPSSVTVLLLLLLSCTEKNSVSNKPQIDALDADTAAFERDDMFILGQRGLQAIHGSFELFRQERFIKLQALFIKLQEKKYIFAI